MYPADSNFFLIKTFDGTDTPVMSSLDMHADEPFDPTADNGDYGHQFSFFYTCSDEGRGRWRRVPDVDVNALKEALNFDNFLSLDDNGFLLSVQLFSVPH